MKKVRVIKLIISILALLYLFSFLDIGLLKELILKTDKTLFILSVLLAFFRVVIGGMRWNALLKIKKYNFSIFKLTKYYFIGMFFGFFLPTAIGGDVARGFYLFNQGVRKKEVASSIIVERFFGMLSLVVISMLATSFCDKIIHNNQIKIMIIGLSIVFFLVFYFLFHLKSIYLSNLVPRSIIEKIKPVKNLLEDIRTYNYSNTLWLCLIISIIFQILGIISIYLVALALGSSEEFIYFLIFVPIVWLTSMIPVTLNGLGVREGAFVILFAGIGMPKEMCMAISTLFLFQLMLLSLLGLFLFLSDKKHLYTFKKFGDLFR